MPFHQILYDFDDLESAGITIQRGDAVKIQKGKGRKEFIEIVVSSVKQSFLFCNPSFYLRNPLITSQPTPSRINRKWNNVC